VKRNKKTILIVSGALLLAAVMGAVCIGLRVAPTASHALRISELLHPVIEAENQTMHISVSAQINAQTIGLDSDIYMVTQDSTGFVVLERDDVTLYVADNILFLENGKAFKIGENVQGHAASYGRLLPQISALYDVLKITAGETDGETTYSITVTGDQAADLLAAASLGENLPVAGIQKLNLHLTEKNGQLERIRFSGNGVLDGMAVTLQVTLSGFRSLAPGDYSIPDTVKQSAAAVDPDELPSLTQDLYRLVQALASFTDMEGVSGTLKLIVDCGPIQLDTEMKLSDLKASSTGVIDPEQILALPEILGWLCMEGSISCKPHGTSYVYALELESQAMQQLAHMILPELAQYGGNLTAGAVTILLEAGTITSMEVSMEGMISVLIAQIPVAVTATFLFD